jgi:NosR/NirI family nitrous oxide reductase transcriptional regulator
LIFIRTNPHSTRPAQDPLKPRAGLSVRDRRHLSIFRNFGIVAFCLLLFSAMAVPTAGAAGQLSQFLPKATAAEFFPGADRFGPPQGDPPIAPAYQGDRLLGFVYLNSDFMNPVGYSGKPINLLVGIDLKGVVTGVKLVEHKEPIVLIGIPEKRIVDAINSLVGKNMAPVAAGTEHPPQVDIVSGATVTMLVIGDSVVRSAVRLIRSGRITASGAGAPAAAAARVTKTIDLAKSTIASWQDLLGDGSIRRLHLTVGEVNEAFARSGNAAAAANPESGDPDQTFIDLYVALATVPTIGRSLLGEEAYEQLMARLKPGQQAVVVAGDGAYSFKGSGYVRGGIFDRIELIQEGAGARFRDRNHTRLGGLKPPDAPDLREIGLFVVPDDFVLDPAQPWHLQLLVQRSIGAREKAFLTFDLDYTLPEKYLRPEQPAAAVATQPAAAAAAKPAEGALEEPLWKRMWRDNAGSIAVVAVAVGLLTVIFFFQNILVRRPRLNVWVRRAYLLFILVWLGWYANAQLSVVNTLTFTNALVTGFHWEYFLTAPLIFILWSGVAASLLFWGRGPFCGWLCPFGALQELLNNVAQALGVPQLRIPWGLHERLWPIKYMIFLGLFGVSLYSVGFAEQLSEVEPFKTAIVLKFVRNWPFVVYAVALLVVGLFIERFFCRYLCPLGAALAIPGRLRMFEWLRRWPECGSPCHRCANECPVQAIHPEGHINVNECIYCMHCQELYWDDTRCPHMIQLRLKRERREALTSPSMRTGGTPPKTTITRNGKPIAGAAVPEPSTTKS